MELLQTLLLKFWKNAITSTELSALKQLVEEKEEEVKKGMQDDFHVLGSKKESVISAEKSKKILDQLHIKIAAAVQQPAIVKKINHQPFWRAAVACLITGIIALQLFYFTKAKSTAVESGVSAETLSLKNVSNKTGKVMILNLPDGSQVKLYPAGEVSYNQSFDGRARNISLTGKAFFKVAKDSLRPFTVYANGFATTALGTQFIVNAEKNDTVSVKLFEGKVVIHSTEKGSNGWKVQYLLPRQQVIYCIASHRQVVVNFRKKEPAIYAGGKLAHQKEEQSIMLAFSNEPLDKVFTKLERSCHVKIACKKEELASLFFTGTFIQSDKIETILPVICTMNGLAYTLNYPRITITKLK